MVKEFFRKYLSIIFVLATFMGVFHHHHDAKPHNDCQICTIQTNLANADTPSESVYLTKLTLYSESIITPLCSFFTLKIHTTLHARAPPQIS